jgi:hypothetical protein
MSKRKMILSIAHDAKTSKGEKLGFLTGILYLAPSRQSGREVCPMAKLANCESACLYTAGRGAMSNVQNARLAKTKRFFEDRENFMLDLVHSIEVLLRKAKREGLTPLVRLNGTSDIRWEHVRIDEAIGGFSNIMSVFPEVQFYDYTKIANRHAIPANYDLTFSYSGVSAYGKFVETAIARGMRIAVVWRSVEAIPANFLGMPVLPGDDSDVRHIEPQGAVVALYAKGAAKRDTSGFVQDA